VPVAGAQSRADHHPDHNSIRHDPTSAGAPVTATPGERRYTCTAILKAEKQTVEDWSRSALAAPAHPSQQLRTMRHPAADAGCARSPYHLHRFCIVPPHRGDRLCRLLAASRRRRRVPSGGGGVRAMRRYLLVLDMDLPALDAELDLEPVNYLVAQQEQPGDVVVLSRVATRQAKLSPLGLVPATATAHGQSVPAKFPGAPQPGHDIRRQRLARSRTIGGDRPCDLESARCAAGPGRGTRWCAGAATGPSWSAGAARCIAGGPAGTRPPAKSGRPSEKHDRRSILRRHGRADLANGFAHNGSGPACIHQDRITIRRPHEQADPTIVDDSGRLTSCHGSEGRQQGHLTSSGAEASRHDHAPDQDDQPPLGHTDHT